MESSPSLTFGRNVKQFRDDKGLSQEELAETVGLQYDYIRILELGEYTPALATILCLARALEVEPALLFRGIDDVSDHALKASQEHHGITLHFKYDQYDAKYDLEEATVSDFQAVIETLRSGLDTSLGKTDVVVNAFIQAVTLWPKANPSDLWTFLINRAYCDRANHPPASDRLNLEQSWKRTSGWALERVLVRHYGPFLQEKGIKLSLDSGQKSAWLSGLDDPRINPDKADVLVIGSSHTEELLGTIHVKASIAERRTDDVPMSQALIEAGLLSVFWTMDAKSTPSDRPVNRGEFGQSAGQNEVSEKRKDFEVYGHFSNCFSYNRNTIPTPIAHEAVSQIVTCSFENPDDAFSRFLINSLKRNR